LNYTFSLKYEDRTNLTLQLQDYGLKLDWYEHDVKMMVSRY